ncbi:hypothetical protein BaRGS_00021008 [Batillaria attramentaria]|uniref:Uncharacterized protein n=1 Tax=Batillaria attramentaria TaxID=370345 RepID=A0ABD0KKY0_9CAEN
MFQSLLRPGPTFEASSSHLVFQNVPPGGSGISSQDKHKLAVRTAWGLSLDQGCKNDKRIPDVSVMADWKLKRLYQVCNSISSSCRTVQLSRHNYGGWSSGWRSVMKGAGEGGSGGGLRR